MSRGRHHRHDPHARERRITGWIATLAVTGSLTALTAADPGPLLENLAQWVFSTSLGLGALVLIANLTAHPNGETP